MATLSSHVLDSVSGSHAAGIRIECAQLGNSRDRVAIFDVVANEEGRIAEPIDCKDGDQLEVLFYGKDYFSAHSLLASSDSAISGPLQIMEVVVVRITIPDATARYHIPIVLSPHSYSVWWSS